MMRIKLFKTRIACLFLLSGIVGPSVAAVRIEQNVRFMQDSVYKPNIKTVLLYRSGWEMSYPLIDLNSNDKLKLSFDDLDGDIKSYYFTIVHCDANWNESGLSPAEYIDGFTEDRISDYSHSFNTTFNYTHYNLVFPTENMKPRLSGNYILKVYENFDQSSIVFTRRFMIVDRKIKINVAEKRPSVSKFYNTGQKIDFSLETQGLALSDPLNELKILVTQNNRWDNALRDIKPSYVSSNHLEYSWDDRIIFAGGSEFRHFDTKSIHYQSQYVHKIAYEAPYYHFYLYPSELKQKKLYFFDNDINGRFLISVSDRDSAENEADYVYVHFSLPCEEALADGKFYVFGALNYWSCNKDNEMAYDAASRSYQAKMLLKQGYYNYGYAFVPQGSAQCDLGYIEGDHYETENDYSVLVYYHPFNQFYDALVGIETINSLKTR
ncbi:MAG: DUF5103 domain-containing protein [Bacteroidota bacterium]|nr:DUF5103 domain-containing protein [Bacteroidota bacterium]